MLLWIVIAFLTAAAILAVLAPLARAPKGDDAAAHAARVYRDQLSELERDKAEGRIGASEAESARAEIARRLIGVDSEARGGAAAASLPGQQFARRGVAVVALLGIPILSLALYLGLGAPSLPGAPLAARLSNPVEDDEVELLIAKVEEHLAKNPEDGRGWEVIAPVYLRLGRAQDSVQAYRSTIRLLGSTAVRETGLGQAILAAEDGIVTAEARTAFQSATTLDPEAPAPRFFLALAAEQEGKAEEAARIWRELLAKSPSDAPWRPATEEALARVAPSETPPAGPASEQVAVAENLPADEQAAMIEGMVTRLAERLKSEPDDVEGWLRLIRSYVVLGRSDAAAEAARSALAGVHDDAARERVEALIADLGVTPAGAVTP